MLIKLGIPKTDWCNPCQVVAPVVGFAQLGNAGVLRWILDERPFHAASLRGRVVRVEFFKASDRFVLRVDVFHGYETTVYTEAVEASQVDNFPAI